jgi:hypothetical protein
MISRIVIAAALVVCVAFPASATATPQSENKAVTAEKTEPSTPAMVIKRGNKIGRKSPVVALDDIVKDPEKYENKKIILEGTVKAVCQKKGCWMELVTAPDQAGVRVTFKDYGFFVPKDAAGLKVRAEGKIKLTTLSKEDADHYEEEGANLVRNADGTVSEIGFVAYGVELCKYN